MTQITEMDRVNVSYDENDDDREEPYNNESSVSTNGICKKLDFGLPNNYIHNFDISEISEIDHVLSEEDDDYNNESFVFPEEPPHHHVAADWSMTEDSYEVSKTSIGRTNEGERQGSPSWQSEKARQGRSQVDDQAQKQTMDKLLDVSNPEETTPVEKKVRESSRLEAETQLVI
jgi:hypothetical protein